MRQLSSTLAFLSCICPTFLFAVSVTVSVTDSHCGLANGAISTTVSGGLPPYTYSWSNGATTSALTGLLPGTYSVTVTDGLLNTAQASADVVNVMTLNTITSTEVSGDCAGSCSGIADIYENGLGGTAPYMYSYPYVQHPSPGFARFEGMCYGSNLYTVTDANGCAGTVDAFIGTNAMWSTFPPLSVTPACGVEANGAIIMPSVGSYAAFLVTGTDYYQVHEFFEEGPYTIGGLSAGQYSVGLFDATLGMLVYCTMPVEFTVGALAEPCGGISGTVYHDADQDCIYNGSDIALPYKVLTIGPGPAYAITDGNGHYEQNLNYGAYEIGQTLIDEVQLCPAQDPVPFTIDAFTPSAVIDMADSSTVPHDVSIWVSVSDARPGFSTSAWVHVTNNSAYPSGALTISLNYDPLLQSASTSQWTIPGLNPYAAADHMFHADVPADIDLLGTVLTYTGTVANTASEVNTTNNSATATVTITGSYDPNDKQARTSSELSDHQYFLDQDQHITYTVRFQNTGTAAAQTVVIRDTLDEDLEIASLEILGASHAFTPSFGQGRELIFTFNNINLPDSGTDHIGSQGFISYRIRPVNDIVLGDVIENTAAIYFDFNPPIITNTVAHVVDFSTAVVHAQGHVAAGISAWPNPTGDFLNILLKDTDARLLGVFDMQGARFQPAFEQRSGRIRMDVRDLPSGMYAISTTAGQARFVRK